LLLLLLRLLLLLLLPHMSSSSSAPQQQDFGLANVEVLPRRSSKRLHHHKESWQVSRRGQVDLGVVSKLCADKVDTQNSHPHPLLLQITQQGFRHTQIKQGRKGAPLAHARLKDLGVRHKTIDDGPCMGGGQKGPHPCAKSISHTQLPHHIHQKATIYSVICLGKIQKGCDKLAVSRQALSQQL
jgi:hypothetical protein